MTLERLTERARNVILDISKNVKENKVVVGEVLSAIEKSLGMGNFLIQTVSEIKIDKDQKIILNALIKEAYYQAIKFDHTYVGTEHLLVALLRLSASSDTDRLKTELVRFNIFPAAIKAIEKGKKTPLLEAFGENLNQRLHKEYNKPILPRSEYNSLVSILLQKNNANALLVGEKGVGKTALIELLARNINSLDVPPLLVGYQIIEFDLLAFMTNVFNKGGLDFGLAALVEEIKSVGRVILSVKNFQNIFFATNAGFTVPMFYSMFKSSLDSAGIKMISSLHTSLYEKIIGENEHILEKFSVIEVKEPNEADILKVLELNASYLSQYHNVVIAGDVIKYVYKKAKEELKDIKFPQKGLDLLDQACSRLLANKSRIPEGYKLMVDKSFLLTQNLDKNIEKGDYSSALKTNVKLKTLEDKLLKTEEKIFLRDTLKLTVLEVDEALQDFDGEKKAVREENNLEFLNTLSEKIKKRIIGQDEAVNTVVRSLIRAKLGLRSKKRPLGNFLFLGPTGVGKTELGKALSEITFGEGSLIRLDMSDFSEKHNVARLVGAPPGYIGYGEGGELTQKIDLRPDSVVLFDEIEKAHPDVLNILLQIMDEGELTDAKGNSFDFSKAVVILTSNLGTDIIHNPNIGFDEKTLSDDNVEARLKLNLKRILKPELINRFDEIIVFKRLKQKEQVRVLNLLINEVQENLKAQDVILRIDFKSKKHLIKLGYSEEYGARALRRTVEKELLDRIAEVLLATKQRPLIISSTVNNKNLVVAGLVQDQKLRKSKKLVKP